MHRQINQGKAEYYNAQNTVHCEERRIQLRQVSRVYKPMFIKQNNVSDKNADQIYPAEIRYKK
jgi:hypothetical protein